MMRYLIRVGGKVVKEARRIDHAKKAFAEIRVAPGTRKEIIDTADGDKVIASVTIQQPKAATATEDDHRHDAGDHPQGQSQAEEISCGCTSGWELERSIVSLDRRKNSTKENDTRPPRYVIPTSSIALSSTISG